MPKQLKQIVFMVALIISLLMIIHGITREKKIERLDEVVEHYELKETRENASALCLSCMGIE